MPGPIDIQGLLQNIQRPQSSEINPRYFEIEISEDQDSFADMLTRAIDSVDETMKTSEKGIQDYVAGKRDDVHNVMIDMQRAQLSFQMMVEIRNKAIETYNEISRMQI